jgi:hypothetical protein
MSGNRQEREKPSLADIGCFGIAILVAAIPPVPSVTEMYLNICSQFKSRPEKINPPFFSKPELWATYLIDAVRIGIIYETLINPALAFTASMIILGMIEMLWILNRTSKSNNQQSQN